MPVYWGCKITASEYIYEISLRSVARSIGIELVDLENAACCGIPVRNMNSLASAYMAARVTGLGAMTGGGEMLVPCTLCHFSLSEASFRLSTEPDTRDKITGWLGEEGIDSQRPKLWHTVDLLHDRVGLETIKSLVVVRLGEIKLATHPGCYMIRPGRIGRIDSAENPRKLDELTEALGIEIVDYPQKLECCGGLSLRPTAALAMAGDKLKGARESGADGLVCSCPHCFEMLDSKQDDIGASTGVKPEMPVVYYTQLLGLALGLREEELGLNLNRSPVDRLLARKAGLPG